MHLLVICIIALTIISFLVGLIFSIRKEDKSFESILTRGFKSVGVIAIMGLLLVGIYYMFDSFFGPSLELEVEAIRIEEIQEGGSMIKIYFSGEFENLDNTPIEVVGWFSLEHDAIGSRDDNPSLKDYNNVYTSTAGGVSTSIDIVPVGNNLDESKRSYISIPLDELHLEQNYIDLKETSFRVLENNRVIVKLGAFQNGEQLSISDEWSFVAIK